MESGAKALRLNLFKTRATTCRLGPSLKGQPGGHLHEAADGGSPWAGYE